MEVLTDKWVSHVALFLCQGRRDLEPRELAVQFHLGGRRRAVAVVLELDLIPIARGDSVVDVTLRAVVV